MSEHQDHALPERPEKKNGPCPIDGCCDPFYHATELPPRWAEIWDAAAKRSPNAAEQSAFNDGAHYLIGRLVEACAESIRLKKIGEAVGGWSDKAACQGDLPWNEAPNAALSDEKVEVAAKVIARMNFASWDVMHESDRYACRVIAREALDAVLPVPIGDRPNVVNAFALIAQYGRPVETQGDVLIIATDTPENAHALAWLTPEIERGLMPLGVSRLRLRVSAADTATPASDSPVVPAQAEQLQAVIARVKAECEAWTMTERRGPRPKSLEECAAREAAEFVVATINAALAGEDVHAAMKEVSDFYAKRRASLPAQDAPQQPTDGLKKIVGDALYDYLTTGEQTDPDEVDSVVDGMAGAVVAVLREIAVPPVPSDEQIIEAVAKFTFEQTWPNEDWASFGEDLEGPDVEEARCRYREDAKSLLAFLRALSAVPSASETPQRYVVVAFNDSYEVSDAPEWAVLYTDEDAARAGLREAAKGPHAGYQIIPVRDALPDYLCPCGCGGRTADHEDRASAPTEESRTNG